MYVCETLVYTSVGGCLNVKGSMNWLFNLQILLKLDKTKCENMFGKCDGIQLECMHLACLCLRHWQNVCCVNMLCYGDLLLLRKKYKNKFDQI